MADIGEVSSCERYQPLNLGSTRKSYHLHSETNILTFSDRLIAGVNPANTLSVVFDVGTDNENLLGDELYVVGQAFLSLHMYADNIHRDGLIVVFVANHMTFSSTST